MEEQFLDTELSNGEGSDGLNPLYLATHHKTAASSLPSIGLRATDTGLTEQSTSANVAGQLNVNQTDDANKVEENSNSNAGSSRPEKLKVERKQTVSTEEVPANFICPRVNCPEKIVLCLDLSYEVDKVTFRSRSGDKFTPIKLLKRAIGLFVHSKHMIDIRHEFALVFLEDSALWMSDFTSDPEKIMYILEDVNDTYQCETFDMTSLFDVIQSRVPIPKVDNPQVIPPPHVIRVILMYGRSQCVPNFSSQDSLKILHSSPHFFLDAFYIHEPPTENNKCEEIFDVLCDLDDKGLSYIVEVSKNPTKLYDCMAQLLPHPLQRPLQRDVSYSILPKAEQQ